VSTGIHVLRAKKMVRWSEIDKIISWMLSSQSQLHKFDIDIHVKEPTLESLTKKKKEYQPPRFMSVSEAAVQLLEIIRRKDGDCKELGML
jgi:diphthine synthase